MYTAAANKAVALAFENRFAAELPGDPDLQNTRRQVSGACYSFVEPTPVAAPVLVAFSKEAAAELELDEDDCRSPWFTDLLSGNLVPDSSRPYAMCYGGHQFGTWAGQLGDGRAINLGEITNRAGNRWTIPLRSVPTG